MTESEKPQWSDLRDHSPIAFFELAGWSAVVGERDGKIWVAVQRGEGDDSIQEAETMSSAIRHYSSLLHQAATRSQAVSLASATGASRS